ncbi:hypothetical protein HDV00_005278 [Rhizophlyctis rosea]|nr:hypothetical protein HDV00_005278 [Rhizophlyctis rosea]
MSTLPLPVRLLASLASAALGIATYIHLTKTVNGPFFGDMTQRCFSVKDFSNLPVDGPKLPDFEPVGIPGVDNFLCLITPFFQAALENPLNFTLSLPIFIVFFGCFPIFALESSRSSTRLVASWFAIHALLFQTLGISVTVPLLWLPSYILASKKVPGPLSRPVVLAVGVATIAFAFVVYGLLSTSLGHPGPFNLPQTHFISAFNVDPLLIPIFWVPVKYALKFFSPATKRSALSGSGSAIGLYTVIGVVLFIAHWYFMYSFFVVGSANSGKGWGDVWAVVVNPEGSQLAAHFLVVDAVVLWLSMVLWFALEEGLFAAVASVGMLLVAGPGTALCILAGMREGRMGKLSAAAVEVGGRKKKE